MSFKGTPRDVGYQILAWAGPLRADSEIIEVDFVPGPEDFKFPVWGTQGGGLVREIRTPEGYKYIFVVAPPQGMGLTVGDFMPDDWGTIPANPSAREIDLDDAGSHFADEVRDPEFWTRTLGYP